MNYINVIREFIVENFLFGDGHNLKDNSSLIEDGIIDSTGVVELIAFIEENYNIVLADNELVQENFSSLNAIDRFLKSKLNSTAA